MGSKKRFAINGFAQVFAFFVSLGITFFLTPFIVSRLGAAAYGFVGLASNFVGYIQLCTVALNAMAGRYISVAVHQGRIDDARKYFNSVFFSNIALTSAIGIICLALIYHLEFIIQIPNELIPDVKLLFGCIFLNFFISLVFNVYNVSTFIQNRLDLSSTRLIISNFIKAGSLVALFCIFSPSLWYIGLAAIISTVYVIITNIHFCKTLTPQLILSFKYFDIKSIKELLSIGVWSVIGKIATLVSNGFDLLLANLYIGPVQMGVLAISRRVPALTLTLYERINSIFSPPWTKLYAQGKEDHFHKSILKSLRLFGIASMIPTVVIFTFSDWFYQLWVPSQSAKQLYLLTMIGCIDLPIAMPLQPIYNIFPITKNIKGNCLISLATFSCSLLFIFIGLNIVDNTLYQTLIIAGTSATFNAIKSLTFLPLYGAHCSKINVKLLYKSTLKSVLGFFALQATMLLVKSYFETISWINLLAVSIATAIIGCIIGYAIILNSNDRKEIINIFKKITRSRI